MLVEEGSGLSRGVFEGLGLAWPLSATPSVAELKDLAYEEKFGELMGWGQLGRSQ